MSFLLNIYIDLKELIYLLFYLGNTDWMSFRFLDFFEVHMIWGGFALYRHMLDRFTLYRCVRFKLYFIYLAVHWGRVFTVILHSHNTQIYVVQMRPIYIVLAVHWGREIIVILHSHNTQIYVVQMDHRS